MRKTEEEILRDAMDRSSFQFLYTQFPALYSGIITAMQTFAQQESEAEAVGFAEWKDNNTKESPYVVGKFEYKNWLYTTAQLYAIYLKNKF